MAEIQKKKLLTFTGPSGVGKSTGIEITKSLCYQKNISFYQAFDYPHLKKYAQDNWNDESRVIWPLGSTPNSDDFMISLPAYIEASTIVTTALAQEIRELLPLYDVIATEVARGAGEPPDSYGNQFFSILVRQLGELVELANIEIVIPDTQVLIHRAEERYEKTKHKAPPPSVTKRYITSSGKVQSSLLYAEQSGFDIIYNGQVNNSGNHNQTKKNLTNVLSRVLKVS